MHTAANDIPPELTLLKVEGPDLEIASVPVTDLAANWSGNLEMTRALGSRWLRNNEGVLLRVPSAIVPETSNYLLNPLHADAKRFAIAEVFQWPFDVSLKG